MVEAEVKKGSQSEVEEPVQNRSSRHAAGIRFNNLDRFPAAFKHFSEESPPIATRR
jgi:hypothetical protein